MALRVADDALAWIGLLIGSSNLLASKPSRSWHGTSVSRGSPFLYLCPCCPPGNVTSGAARRRGDVYTSQTVHRDIAGFSLSERATWRQCAAGAGLQAMNRLSSLAANQMPGCAAPWTGSIHSPADVVAEPVGCRRYCIRGDLQRTADRHSSLVARRCKI